MNFLRDLPNTEFVFDGTVEDLLTGLQPGPSGTTVVASGMWFDYDSPDYSHFDAYDAAFDRIGAKINKALGEIANRKLGFDEESFEPVPILMRHDIFADYFFHWPQAKLILTSMHEDKELPIEITLIRLP